MNTDRTGFHTCKECHKNRIPLKSYHYRPQGKRTIGRPKDPILHVYDDDDDDDDIVLVTQVNKLILVTIPNTTINKI